MGQTQLLWAIFTWAKCVFFHPCPLRVWLSWMTGWDVRSCCPGEDDSHGLPYYWLLPGEGSRIHVDGRQDWGIVLLWDLSSCHCPEPLSAQPRFRTKLSGHSWYLEIISWKMGDLRGELPHRFVFSLNVGTGTFLPPCAIIGALLLPQEVSCLLLATPSHIDA